MNLTRKTALVPIISLIATSCSTNRQTARTAGFTSLNDSFQASISTAWHKSVISDSLTLKLIEITLPADSSQPAIVRAAVASRIRDETNCTADTFSQSQFYGSATDAHSSENDSRETSGTANTLLSPIIGLLTAILIISLLKNLFKR